MAAMSEPLSPTPTLQTLEKETPAQGGRRAGDAIPGGVVLKDCRPSTIRVKRGILGVQVAR